MSTWTFSEIAWTKWGGVQYNNSYSYCRPYRNSGYGNWNIPNLIRIQSESAQFESYWELSGEAQPLCGTLPSLLCNKMNCCFIAARFLGIQGAVGVVRTTLQWNTLFLLHCCSAACLPITYPLYTPIYPSIHPSISRQTDPSHRIRLAHHSLRGFDKGACAVLWVLLVMKTWVTLWPGSGGACTCWPERRSLAWKCGPTGWICLYRSRFYPVGPGHRRVTLFEQCWKLAPSLETWHI